MTNKKQIPKKEKEIEFEKEIEKQLSEIISIRNSMTCSKQQKYDCQSDKRPCAKKNVRCWTKIEEHYNEIINLLQGPQKKVYLQYLKRGIILCNNYFKKYNFKYHEDFNDIKFADDIVLVIREICLKHKFQEKAKTSLYYRFLNAATDLLYKIKKNLPFNDDINHDFNGECNNEGVDDSEYDENEDANRMQDVLNEICPYPNKNQKFYIRTLIQLCKITDKNIKSIVTFVEFINKNICNLQKTNEEYKDIKEIDLDSFKGFIKYCIKQDDSEFIKNTLDRFLHFSKYAAVIKHLINFNKEETNQQIKDKKQNNPNTINQTKIKELIKSFNKIRKMLSVCLNSDDTILTSADLYNACKNFGYEIEKDKNIKSTCEKELHRITSLFRQDVGFNVTETIKSFSPNKFAKIYDIHAVPNILLNFAILDILNEKNMDNEYIPKKIPQIIDLLFLNIDEKDIDDIKDNFRKHALRDRLIELSEYGFVKKDFDRYTLNPRYLNKEQINALKLVVPFFCGCYPFASIGHFLANRLKISDVFVFESFNIKNILNDCVTYDLLEAIKNKEEVSLKLYNNEKPVKFRPNEIYTDKNNKSLLTVKDKNDNKYLLSQIDTVEQEMKTNNLIFSEIYSFYYRIIEESLKNRTPENDIDESTIKEIVGNFGTNDTEKIFIPMIKNIIKKLQNLDNYLIPLTTLELRWLKTILLDKRIDLFVDNKEVLFSDLVKDFEPFDLSSFKDINGVSYNEYREKGVFKNMDKNEFQKDLRNKEKIIYSLKENKIKK